jgi:hypothetical protein
MGHAMSPGRVSSEAEADRAARGGHVGSIRPQASGRAAPASVQRAVGDGGAPLPAGLRGEMEARFGHDFARVRVHAHPPAGRVAQAFGAQAFTLGPHIGFAAGAYQPGAARGRALLAHELAHVVQQTQPGGHTGLAFKLEPAPGATPVAPTATPVRGENGVRRVAAAIELLQQVRDLVTADPSQAASQQHYVLGAIKLLEDNVLGSRMTPAFATNQNPRDDAKRCENALGALRFLESGFRVAVPNLGNKRTWDSAIGALQLAQAPLAQLLNYLTPKERFKAMVSDAAVHGMPVKMVNSVAWNSSVAQTQPTDDERYGLRENTVYLKEGSLNKGLQAIRADQATSVGALYHESTHAFLVSHRDVEPYKTALDEATAHYTGAPVGEQEEPAEDPYRIAQEAAAEYVEARVRAWWYAYGKLNAYASRGLLTATMLNEIRTAYEAEQSRTTFGYDESGSHQRHTSRPMGAALLKLINEDLLEGKIARPFDDVPEFRAVIDKARANKQLP